jgi:hypothetical protein
MRGSDFRKRERFPADSSAGLVSPRQDGTKTIRVGRCTNQSKTGIQLLVAGPIEVDTFVEFQVREPRIHGTGTVRYCRRVADGYAIGIHFGDFRGSKRVPADTGIGLSTRDRHGLKMVKAGRCTNRSETGIQILVAEPIEVDAFVEFQVREPKLHGIGKVRYCQRKGSGYAIGIHFAGGETPQRR